MFEPDTQHRHLAIVDQGDRKLILEDILRLPEDQCLVRQGGFRVFVARAEQIPSVLQEIGRLREIAFREVGEGTGQAIDLDLYDTYYWHLFIWDDASGEIAGGYRVGEGADIAQSKGLAGFYISSLFQIDEAFSPTLQKSLELGRSFVMPLYQKKRLPLFLLWKGIIYFWMRRPEYQYFIGPVSISKYYSDLSKSLIVAFIKAHYYDYDLASYIVPRTPFTVPVQDIHLETALKQIDDMEALENLLEHIEPDYFRLPVLLKQYIRQNARFIGFNLDPNFNDALDGLMLLDLREIRRETLDNLTRTW